MTVPANGAAWRVRQVRLGQLSADAPPVDIMVRHGVIEAIVPTVAGAALAPADIDGRRLIAFPGFVNAHAHSNESFEHGAYEGEPLEVWLALSYPPLRDEALPPRWHYLRAMVLALQSLRSGVTALHDDFLNPGCDAEALEQVLDAYRDAGLRATVAVTLADRPYLDGLPGARALCPPALARQLDRRAPRDVASQRDFFEAAWSRLTARAEPRLGLSLGPRGPQRCTPELMATVAGLAARYRTPVQMHVLETRTQAVCAQQQYGKTFVQVLDEVGLLGERLVLNHAVWLTPDDVARIAARGARVVHNPLSNFKLASGLCPLRRLHAAGVQVALGTDGAATGDSLDYVDTLRMAALVHTLGDSAEAPALRAADVVTMATRHGAASMGAEGRFGEIAVGQRADLTLLDARDAAFVPLNDAQRQLCFAATSRAVHTVVVDGEVVFTGGRCLRVDEAALREEIAEAAEAFRQRRLARASQADDPLLSMVRQVVAQARLQAAALPTC